MLEKRNKRIRKISQPKQETEREKQIQLGEKYLNDPDFVAKYKQ